MARYTRTQARAWARQNLVGVINCTIPSFSGDLTRLNEAAIRHDTRLAIEHGFIGTLAVSEVNITLPEYIDFTRMMKDEAGDKFVITHHASWNTLQQNIEAVQLAEKAGAEFVLMSYPPAFYPESEDDIFDYTKALCDSTNLAVMLFPMFLWGFSPRIHPSDIPTRLIRRLLDACPNIAAIKAEGGFPSIQSVIECHRLFGEEVVISMPIEGELIPLSQIMPLQLSATSDHEFWGPLIPQVFNLLREGKYDEATEIYWRMHTARKVKTLITQQMSGGHNINRYVWKFQGWLQGYNGGPLRLPTQRIHDPQMQALRKGAMDSGLNPSMDPLREFFIGRHPM
jgi:4-hydroxy-tetrahydrodipicolinate synthase